MKSVLQWATVLQLITATHLGNVTVYMGGGQTWTVVDEGQLGAPVAQEPIEVELHITTDPFAHVFDNILAPVDDEEE